MEELTNAEMLEFVAECRETEERVAFAMADLYGWDDETVFLDTSIYLNQPKEVNWAIVCKSSFGRRLNPEYNIHIRTEEDRALKEPLRLLAIKKYSRYRFEAEFSNHVVRTGSFLPHVCRFEELPFYEDEFELAKMNPRGIQIKNDFISAMRLWKASNEYVHYGCSSEEFDFGKFEKVRNPPFLTKPFGGFWASPTKCGRMIYPFDWKDFCHKAEYHPAGKSLYKKFYFCLDIDARIFRIENMDDYNALPKINSEDDVTGREKEIIDFEECMRQGIDAIEYAYSIVRRDENIRDEMDLKMLGWDCDCDSILIMNPNIILKESFLKEIKEGFLIKG